MWNHDLLFSHKNSVMMKYSFQCGISQESLLAFATFGMLKVSLHMLWPCCRNIIQKIYKRYRLTTLPIIQTHGQIFNEGDYTGGRYWGDAVKAMVRKHQAKNKSKMINSFEIRPNLLVVRGY